MLRTTNLWLTITCIPTTSSTYLHRSLCEELYLSHKSTSERFERLQWSTKLWPVCISNVKKTKPDDTTSLEITHFNFLIPVRPLLLEINRNWSYMARLQRIIHVWQRRWTNRVVIITLNHFFKSIKNSGGLLFVGLICVEFCMILAFTQRRQQWFKAVHDKQ
jgi:hypothetical protein